MHVHGVRNAHGRAENLTCGAIYTEPERGAELMTVWVIAIVSALLVSGVTVLLWVYLICRGVRLAMRARLPTLHEVGRMTQAARRSDAD